ncbi:MAG: DUF981 family protein [Sulfolobaceae archaeon]
MTPIHVWLIIYGLTLLAGVYAIYLTKFRASSIKRDGGEIVQDINKSFGLYLLLIGIYSMVTGVWSTTYRPFNAGLQIVVGDVWPLFGVISIILGLGTILKIDTRFLTYLLPIFGIIAIIYGIATAYYLKSVIGVLIYFLSGVAGLLMPWIDRRGIVTVNMILLAIAGILSIASGITLIFS